MAREGRATQTKVAAQRAFKAEAVARAERAERHLEAVRQAYLRGQATDYDLRLARNAVRDSWARVVENRHAEGAVRDGIPVVQVRTDRRAHTGPPIEAPL